MSIPQNARSAVTFSSVQRRSSSWSFKTAMAPVGNHDVSPVRQSDAEVVGVRLQPVDVIPVLVEVLALR
jgi:hypothetical protein